MHTSLNFSATQGIELPDPSKFKKASNNENSQKWFMAGTFTQIEPKGSSIVLEPKRDQLSLLEINQINDQSSKLGLK